MQTFVFDSYTVEKETSELKFNYCLTTQSGESFTFQDKLFVPGLSTFEHFEESFKEILLSLHLILGISYWKLSCPEKIIINSGELTETQAKYWNIVYTKGLGEFFYRNNIDFRGRVVFPFEHRTKQPKSMNTEKHALVGVGGGKDSIVSIELLKKTNIQMTGIVIETQKKYSLIDSLVDVLDIPSLHVQRKIDPQIISLSKKEGFFDGHIPISAIYAWISILVAALNNYSYVVVSNERSANYGNTEMFGEEINHQWSKSMEFEKMTQDYVASFITSDITYFSLLRSFSELKITNYFSQFTQYHNHFSSCNRNFSISRVSDRKWCGECPKCAFVFVQLAAFLSKEKVIAIFGQDLLAKESLLSIYQELLGLKGIKPFECVGTPEETQLAFFLINQKHEFDTDVVMKLVVEKVLPHINVDKLTREVMKLNEENLIPEALQNCVSNI